MIEISFNTKSIFDEDTFAYFPAVSSSSSARNFLKILDITRNHPLVYSGVVDFNTRQPVFLAKSFIEASEKNFICAEFKLGINHERNVVATN